jgi:thiol-disulfide isomerase/thioredoxin
MNMSFLKLSASRCWAVVVLVGCAVLLASNPFPARAGIKAGQTFPDLASFKLEGKLPELRGKVVLVDFWASWCGPCKQSFPIMKEVQDKFASRGFTIVAVCLDEKKANMDSFLKKYPMPFTVLHDPKGRLAEAAGIETMPTSFLLDPDGKVVALHSGFWGDTTRKQYLTEVESALKAAGK